MDPFIKNFFALCVTLIIHVQADDFIYDYFIYKSVPTVTLFSCGQVDNDFRFVRRMNNLGIYVSVSRPQSAFYNVSSHVPRRGNHIFGLLLDTRCQSLKTNEKVIAQTTEFHLYEGIHIWLIIASDFEETIQLLNDNAYSPHTDLTIAIKNDTDGYDLYDVYNPYKERGGRLNIVKMGSWNPMNGINVTLTESKFARRANLYGMPIRVGTVVKYRPPDVSIVDYLEKSKKKSLDPISKYGHAILRHVAELYNFTMVMVQCEEWIAPVNGTEEGLMPKLASGEIDIINSLCSVLSRFATYGRLLMPGYPYRTFFILRSNVVTWRWTELWAPFAMDSWYAIGTMSLLAGLLISTIQMSEYGEGWFTEFGHVSFATLGILCQQGLTFVPNRIAARIALLFFLFFGVLLFNYYGASVVSARLSKPPEKMNDSLYSLAKSHIRLGSDYFRVVDDNLETRSHVEWEVRYFNEEVWKKLPMSRYMDNEEGLKRAAQGGFAYHCSAEVSYPYVEAHWDEKAICEIAEVHVLTPRVLSYYERADSPFSELLRIGILKTANMGLQRRTVIRSKPKKPYCSPLAQSLQSITFFDVAPAVITILIGTVMSLVVLQFERIFYKLHSSSSTSPGATKMPRVGGKKTLLRH